MKNKFTLQTKNGNHYDVPVEGSLGLLALGYVGLLLWRQKRLENRERDKDQLNKGIRFQKTSIS